MGKLILYMTALLFLLPAKSALAQEETDSDYYFQHYTDENGLPQNSVSDFTFDQEGFLWLASQMGLLRFDGRSFTLYNPSNTPAMESSKILFVKRAQNNDILFLTENHYLYNCSFRNGYHISRAGEPSPQSATLLNAKRQAFDFDNFLTQKEPPAEHVLREAIFQTLQAHTERFFTIDPGHVYFLYNDSLFYYDSRKLSRLAACNIDNLYYLVTGDTFYMLRKGTVSAAFRDGRMITGNEAIGGDLLKDKSIWDQPNSSFSVFSGERIHLLVNKRLYRLSRDSTDKLHAAFVLTLDQLNYISHVDYSKKLDLLIVGTQTDGFYIIRKKKFLLPQFSDSSRMELKKYAFGPLLSYKGQYIRTTYFMFNAKGDFREFEHTITHWQRCLFEDKAGHIWSSDFNLPKKVTGEMKLLKTYAPLDKEIVDYQEDGNGTLYCLTQKSIWRLEGDSFRLVFSNPQPALTGNNVSFNQVFPSVFWIATSAGLVTYDLQTGATNSIPELSNAQVRAIYKCRDGSVLIGTYGQGYYYYYKQHFFKMPLDRNNFLTTAHCFIEDNRGYIWIAGNKGLFQVRMEDIKAYCDARLTSIYYYYYGRQDGLEATEFNGGVNAPAVLCKDGFAALLSMKGIVAFYPDSIQPKLPAGGLYIVTAEMNDKAYTGGFPIDLKPDYNSFTVAVSSPFLGSANNLNIEYYLTGLSTMWQPLPQDGTINLTRLAPGNYILRIRKMNGFGVNNYTYKEIRLVVHPHFYQSPWFIAASILVFLILVFFLVRLRIKLRQKQKEVREHSEKLKGTVQTLQETVRQLQESQRALSQSGELRERLISLVIHDLRSPIRFLGILAEDLYEHYHVMSREELDKRLYSLKNGTQAIYNFSEDFLVWVTSQKDNFKIVKRQLLVSELFQEISDFFKDQITEKGNRILYEAAEGLSIYSDPHILITIIRNLVDNANKYTRHGNITVGAHEEKQSVVISVADTGKGMSKAQVDAFFGNNDLRKLKSGSQLGHQFIADLTRRIDGRMRIDSEENKGTTIQIILGRQERV